MADKKISALPAASTPLAGTEVLPIVQSGITDQVSVANLTAGRAISATQLTLSTQNLIISTAGKGIDFSANGGDVLSQYDEGTWTPNQGAGLTVVGAFSSTGTFTRIGRQVTVQGRVVGATSIACSAFGVISSNLPFSSGTTTFVGSLFGGSPATGGTTVTSAGIVYSVNAVSAGGDITFTITYFI